MFKLIYTIIYLNTYELELILNSQIKAERGVAVLC
jgi:hypothetical protein